MRPDYKILPIFLAKTSYICILKIYFVQHSQTCFQSLLLSPAVLHLQNQFPSRVKPVLIVSFSREAQRRGSSHDGVTSQRQQLQLRLFLLVLVLLLIWLQWLWLQVKGTSGRHRKWFLHGCGPPYTRVVFRASWSQELCAYCLLQCKKMYILCRMIFFLL